MLGKNQQGGGRGQWGGEQEHEGLTLTDQGHLAAVSLNVPWHVKQFLGKHGASCIERAVTVFLGTQPFVSFFLLRTLSIMRSLGKIFFLQSELMTGTKETEFCHQELSMEHNEARRERKWWGQFRAERHPGKPVC